MLAWLGKVVVLLVEGVGLDSGTTVYRERKEYRNRNKQAIPWHLCNANKDDDMSGLMELKLVLNME